MDQCAWMRWTTRFEWPAEGDLPPVRKDRLASFLLRVFTTLDALAARLTGTPDVEALAALLERLDPMPAPWTDDQLAALRDWTTTQADLAQVLPVIQHVDDVLELEPTPIARIVVMLFCERVTRSMIAEGRHALLDDPSDVFAAADSLAQQVREMLAGVGRGAIAASEYRTM